MQRGWPSGSPETWKLGFAPLDPAYVYANIGHRTQRKLGCSEAKFRRSRPNHPVGPVTMPARPRQ